MINTNQPACLVVDVQKGRVLLRCVDSRLEDVLSSLGGRKERQSDRWIFTADNEDVTIKLFASFRDLGFPFFASESGWPPAAIFEMYREKGLLIGSYREAVNMGVNRGGWRVVER